jgi:hypothetical protein
MTSSLILAMQARGVRAKRRVLRPISGRSWRGSPSISNESTKKRCGIRLFHCRDQRTGERGALGSRTGDDLQGARWGRTRLSRISKDPLFLASSVFVKKPERIIALSLIMVLCLLVYRLAEYRLRARLAETEQTIPDQVQKPTARPTMRWVFQCFEGIELLHVQTSTTSLTIVLRLESVHRLILALLGPLYEKIYNPSG